MPSAQEQTVEGNSNSSITAGLNDASNSGGGDAAPGKDQPGTMFHAAKVGDADFIQSEILNGADVNKKDSNGERYDAILRCVTKTIGCVLLLEYACLMDGGTAPTYYVADTTVHQAPRTSALMSPDVYKAKA